MWLMANYLVIKCGMVRIGLSFVIGRMMQNGLRVSFLRQWGQSQLLLYG